MYGLGITVAQCSYGPLEVKVPLLSIFLLDCLRQNEPRLRSSSLELQWSPRSVRPLRIKGEGQRSSNNSSKTKLKLIYGCHLFSSSGHWASTPKGQRSSNKSSSSSSSETKLKLVRGHHLLISSGYRASPHSVQPLWVKGPPTTPPPPPPPARS